MLFVKAVDEVLHEWTQFTPEKIPGAPHSEFKFPARGIFLPLDTTSQICDKCLSVVQHKWFVMDSLCLVPHVLKGRRREEASAV